MTPVEERPDHEEAKRVAGRLREMHCDLAAAIIEGLLTEHSAREEDALLAFYYHDRRACANYCDMADESGALLGRIRKRALPATEPAQPYPKGGLPHGEHPYDYGYEPAQPEEEPRSYGPGEIDEAYRRAESQ